LLQVEKLPDDSNKSTSTTELSFARNALPTIKYYLTTEDFLDKIIEDLRANGFTDEISRESIKSMVSLSVIEDTELLNIDVTSTDPELSLNIAKAYAGIVPADVMTMYKNVEVEIRNTPRTGEANSRGTVRNTIIGFLGGAILAVIGVFVFSMLDVTVHDRKKIEENFDLPVLGVIPKVDNPVSSKGDK
jgi:capsular polysaccharide biosynthesis protein